MVVKRTYVPVTTYFLLIDTHTMENVRTYVRIHSIGLK